MRKRIVFIITLLLILCLVGCREKEERSSQSVSIDHSSSAAQSTRFNLDDEIVPLQLIYDGDYTNYGLNNYSGSNYQENLKNLNYKLNNYLHYSNTGYEVIPNSQLFIWKDENNVAFAYSGVEPLEPYAMFTLQGTDINNARNNRTGYLMAIFQSEEEAELAKEEYLTGKLFTEGAAYPAEQTIVMNGRIREGLNYFVEDNEYWLPITDLFDLRGLSWRETGNGIALQYLDVERNFLEKEIDGNTQYKNRYTQSGEFYIEEMIWGDNFKFIRNVDGKWYAEASLISRYAGMEIQVSPNLVVVTSDPYDIPQEFYIMDAESGTYSPFEI